MKLSRFEMENFKGLRSANLEPGSFTCLVGENNAGKSSVLQALVYLLNRPATLPIAQYYDPTLPIIFRAVFSEIVAGDLLRIAEDHRAKIQAIVEDGTLSVIVTYRPGDRAEITVMRRIPREIRYREDALDDAFRGRRGAAQIRQAATEHFPEFIDAFPEAGTIGAAKAYVQERVAQLPPEEFVPAEAPLPSGISASISTLLPEPIYIPAVKNLNDDLKTSQTTSFGRLLGLLLDDMTPDLVQIQTALEQLNRLMNRVEEGGVIADNRHDKVRALETLVEELLKESFPRVRVELLVPPPELKAILNTAQIFIDDGSKDLIDNKGDGIKRCLTFALLRAYVHKLEEQARQGDLPDAVARPLIFLFEEPELYLHPRSQRVLFAALATISRSHPVVVTTHSPLFFSPGVTAVFVRVSKHQQAPKPVGILNPINFVLDPEKAEVFQLTKYENAEAGFFSNRVVLFEGESDDAFLTHVAKTLNADWEFQDKNIALVRVGGKGNFSKFRRFFEAFGIDVKIVADLDTLTDGFVHLGVNDECVRLRAMALQAIDARIQAANIRPTISAGRIKDKVNRGTWKIRYEAAKTAIDKVQQNQALTPEDRNAIDGLFLWEHDEARLLAIQTDPASKAAIIPLLDAMRALGVCLLSKGAVEEYYPANSAGHGSKPQRAIAATAAVATRPQAQELSLPLAQGRQTELEEIFDALCS